ncbi:hypothetical protein GCM10009860_06090 [Microbacterium mitrae]|uniref:UDP-N-acetylmuramyl pentapeptide phosphotransferase n=1 Tax=Microbacterium mitrae TaxID=664640 RepID=A0A5C8HSF9_9MICO|nr:UDP-N-acetylmuramyl pentapeptide phosphotransferase [Microbacterium mitrae]TXK05993.1 UDP-N-acetylmuramyl pentapeptide phosphotransferase [Microbacterium mitrae]
MAIDASRPATAAHAVIADATDPARRKDVLFRKRRAAGEEMSSWWPVAAFVFVTICVVSLLSFIPG